MSMFVNDLPLPGASCWYLLKCVGGIGARYARHEGPAESLVGSEEDQVYMDAVSDRILFAHTGTRRIGLRVADLEKTLSR